MFRLFLTLTIFLNFSLFSFSNEDYSKDYNLLGNKLKIIIKTTNLDKKVFKRIKKTLKNIELIIDPYNSSSFLYRFNALEKNTDISAPDLFVDTFNLMRNYNKITQNSFNPTTFSILTNNSSDLKKIKFYLDTGLYDKCLNISNITTKIRNVFSKKLSCTKISFDSAIHGIIVENIKYILERENLESFYISFGNTVYYKNFESNMPSYNPRIQEILDINQISLKKFSSYSYLDITDKKVRTFNINSASRKLVVKDDIVIIVSSNSPVNNSILSNTLNLLDFDTIKKLKFINSEIPILIIYKEKDFYIRRYSKSFQQYFN
ncbi:MAG: hypothetical protein EVA31_03620 [Candidatus Dadabacteria bacterium]|nr:MAG: hypothetical protein EVA31_03620 [Candidatus Dadabacteria bacterium]